MESEIYGKQHERKKQQYLLYKHFWELNVGSFIFDMGTEKPSKCKQCKDEKNNNFASLNFTLSFHLFFLLRKR